MPEQLQTQDSWKSLPDWGAAPIPGVAVPQQAGPASDHWSSLPDWAPQAAAGGIAPSGAAQPEPTTSKGQQFETGFHNVLTGSAQGSNPHPDVYHTLVSDKVYQDDAGRLQYVDPNTGQLSTTDQGRHVVLRDPADNMLKVYGRGADTDESGFTGLGRVASQGLMTSNLLRPAASVPSAVAASERIGAELPRAIASESPAVHLLGQVIAKAPGGGGLYKSIGSSIERTGQAADRAVEMTGGAKEAETAGASIRSGFTEHFKPKVAAKLDELYGNVERLVDPTMTAPLSRTRQIAADIVARRAASGEVANGKAVETVRGAIEAPNGLTFSGTKDLRSRIGEMLDTGFLPEGMSNAELKQIYGALSDDLRAAAHATGGPPALRAFEVANGMAKATAAWTEKLAKVLGPQGRSDEQIAQTIYRMAQSGGSADVRTLSLVRAAVPREAWQNIASNAISQLGRNAAGEFSPALFVRDYGKLSAQGRRVLFHGVGAGEVVPFLNDIAEVSQKFVQAGKLGNPSGTAGHGAMMALGGFAGAGIMRQSWIEPISAFAAVVGNAGAAKVLSAAPTAASVARWSRAYDVLVHKPGPGAVASFNMASRNLASNVADKIGWRGSIDSLAKQIQGSVQGRPEDKQPKADRIVGH